ncbi:hypothetical protein ONZ45_g6625 [Pleurotus djamor]|nr:hypothetical protein ONZ45_g6625 [Pleurotus djamor]
MVPLQKQKQRPGHWRNIILDTPRFWTSLTLSPKILFTNPTLPNRSKSLPLNVHLSTSENKHEITAFAWLKGQSAARQFISQNIFRLQHLFLDFDAPSDVEELFLAMKGYPAPLLRSLQFRLNRDEYGEVELSHAPVIRQIPELEQIVSSLRILELENILIHFTLPQLPFLTTLLVDCAYGMYGLSIDWIVGVLRHIPNIEVVKLKYVTSDVPAESSSTRLSLPNLRVLDVHGDDLSSSKLFDFLDLPLKLMRTTFGAYYSAYNEALPTTGLQTLYTNFASAHSASPWFRMIIRPAHDSELSLAPLKGDDTVSTLTLNVDPSIFDVSSTIPLAKVSEVTIEGAKRALDWNDILFPFINLRTLEFLDWYAQVPTTLQAPPDSGIKEFVTTVLQFCNLRRKAGYELRKVIVRGSDLTSQYIDTLRECVEVDWDGMEGIGS